jgi:hypothetical protein
MPVKLATWVTLSFLLITLLWSEAGKLRSIDSEYNLKSNISLNDSTESIDSERVYALKKCGGGGCPYTASWLAHVNLYRRLPWWLDSTKMEAASFNM